VDKIKEFFSSRFSMKDIGEDDVIIVSTHMDTSKKMMPNNGQAVSQLEYEGDWLPDKKEEDNTRLAITLTGDDENATNPPSVPPPSQTPHTLLTIKLPILKNDEYDIWAMKMEHYLGHTDYPIWEVIQKRNDPVQVSTYTNEKIRVLPPKTAEEILARERERKARTSLLMAIPEDHLAKFHKITDAKEMWKAIKSRFGRNDKSKKMQKYILKQQFKGFFVSNSEGLHKGYNRFQSLLSQLEIHDHEDLEQVDEFDLEEMDLKWQVAMISTRLKKIYQKTGRKLHFDAKEPVGFDKTKVECFNFHNTQHFAKECRSKGNQESRRRDVGNTRYKARDNRRRPAKQDEHKAILLMEKVLIGLVMLKMIQRTML
nr:ribonuclease H-like domain-containing protein [Tanacetum cinerariifolium]